MWYEIINLATKTSLILQIIIAITSVLTHDCALAASKEGDSLDLTLKEGRGKDNKRLGTAPGSISKARKPIGKSIETGGPARDRFSDGSKEKKRAAKALLGKYDLPDIKVLAHRPVTASSDRVVRARDFILFPRQTASDLMLMVPQLHISQHSGGGKGHQIFLRGFDAEHGEDVALFLEGVPLNEPSHVHGIGYTDLHFLIPETVARMVVLKGPYEPSHGDFSTAGTVNFIIKDRVDKPYISFKGGSFHTFEKTLVFSPKVKGMDFLFAFQAYFTKGFTDHADWKAFKGLAKLTRRFSKGKLSLLWTGYGSDWYAPDTVPEAAVRAGKVDFYGGMDATDGGASQRQHFSLHYSLKTRDQKLDARAYLYRRRTVVYSNYTYFLRFNDKGDQTEQGDKRWVYGAQVEWASNRKVGSSLFAFRIGGGFRGDDIRLELWRTQSRKRWDPAALYDLQVHNFNVFARLEWIPLKWFRAVLGGRFDYFLFEAAGRQDRQLPSGAIEDDALAIQGVRGKEVVSPKLSLIFSPMAIFNVFINYGTGFHSPDARDPVNNPGLSIPRDHALELGFRLKAARRIDIAGSGWMVYQEDEQFFDPLLGRSVGLGSSIRVGGELELRARILPWLYGYLDFSYTNARLTASGDPVVSSPRLLLRTGFTLRHPSGFKACLRFRVVGPRPLAEGQLSESAYLLDLLAEYTWRFITVGFNIENLLFLKWKDAQYFYVSQYDPNAAIAPKPGMHFTAGTPFALKAHLKLTF